MSATAAASLRILPISEVEPAPVADLVNRAFGRYSQFFRGQRTSPRGYRDEAGEEARVIMVERGGRLVATAMIAPAERFADPHRPAAAAPERPGRGSLRPAEHPWSGALYFGLAGVEPEMMNQGLGRLMVQHVEELARAEGFPRIALGTVREFGLVDYYERLAYDVLHEEEYPVGHWDFVVPHHYCEMVKHL